MLDALALERVALFGPFLAALGAVGQLLVADYANAEYTVRRSRLDQASNSPTKACRGGGTGRRDGFKIRFLHGSAGSITAPGTTMDSANTMNYCPNCGGPISQKVPNDDNRERAICDDCGTVHYKNPLIVVGCVAERDGKVLLCKRSIEPRYGYWTVPAGFMELGETLAGGAAREILEEACATVEMGDLFASVDVVDAGQVHLFFKGKLVGEYGVGEESLEAELFSEKEIPWDELAFQSGTFALRKYFEDRGSNHGVHFHELRRSRS